jgi:flavin reductase (DIM6/NTAB) family NADH-FMN oxidoreductase RutF
MLYPVPAVLIGCRDKEGRDNLMTAAWAGTICSDPVMVSVSIRGERYSHHIIENTGEFTISLTNRQLARATDFCGVRSGRNTDKFAEMKLTPLESTMISAPGVAQSPVVLECKVKEILRLGSHDMFIAEVVNVSVDGQYLDDNGKLELERADLIAYSHGEYFALGDKIGKFGYSVRKKAGTAGSGTADGRSAKRGAGRKTPRTN